MSLKKKLKITIGQEPKKEDEPKQEDEPQKKTVGGSWHEKVLGMSNRFRYARHQSVWTDVIFEVGPEATAFPAHKLILALSSSVFEAMFYGPLAEKGERVVIPDIMPDGFEALLEYIYTEMVDFGNEARMLQAWFASDKYCVPGLKEQCEIYFGSCILNSANVWQLLENSIYFNIPALTERCQKYLQYNTKTALSDESFLTSHEDTLKNFMSLDALDVDEITLTKSLIQWGKAQVSNEQKPALEEALAVLKSYIRFEIFSQSDFCVFLDLAPGVISTEDALEIMKHLAKPLSYKLPDWCCRQHWRRNVTKISTTQTHSLKRKLTFRKENFYASDRKFANSSGGHASSAVIDFDDDDSSLSSSSSSDDSSEASSSSSSSP